MNFVERTFFKMSSFICELADYALLALRRQRLCFGSEISTDHDRPVVVAIHLNVPMSCWDCQGYVIQTGREMGSECIGFRSLGIEFEADNVFNQ